MDKATLDKKHGKAPEEKIRTVKLELVDSQVEAHPIAELIIKLNAPSIFENSKTDDTTNSLINSKRKSEVVSKHEAAQPCLKHPVKVSQPLADRILMFEPNHSQNLASKDSIVVPSRIKSFDRERIENICRNKVGDQARVKEMMSESFMSFDFKKNQKTGHYEAENKDQMERIKNITSGLVNGISMSKNRIRNIIEELKNQAATDSTLIKSKPGIKQRSSQFSEIIKKYQESK